MGYLEPIVNLSLMHYVFLTDEGESKETEEEEAKLTAAIR